MEEVGPHELFVLSTYVHASLVLYDFFFKEIIEAEFVIILLEILVLHGSNLRFL